MFDVKSIADAMARTCMTDVHACEAPEEFTTQAIHRFVLYLISQARAKSDAAIAAAEKCT